MASNQRLGFTYTNTTFRYAKGNHSQCPGKIIRDVVLEFPFAAIAIDNPRPVGYSLMVFSLEWVEVSGGTGGECTARTPHTTVVALMSQHWKT